MQIKQLILFNGEAAKTESGMPQVTARSSWRARFSQSLGGFLTSVADSLEENCQDYHRPQRFAAGIHRVQSNLSTLFHF
jgi:hypothetical protein